MNNYDVETYIYTLCKEVQRLSSCISRLERQISTITPGGGGGTPSDITATATATTGAPGTPASASVTVS